MSLNHYLFVFECFFCCAILLAAAAPVGSSKLGVERRLECSTRFFGGAEEAGFSIAIAWVIESRSAVTSESRSSAGVGSGAGAGG